MTQNKNITIESKTQKAIDDFSALFKTQEMRTFLEAFVNEYIKIGDSAFYGGKHCGSDAEHKGAEFIYDTLKGLGIKAEILPFESTRFQFNDADIVYDGQPREIKPYACLSVSTPEKGVTAKLVDVKDGHKSFYETADITGKIALIETKEDFEDGTIVGAFQMYEAEKNGAAAIVLYTNEYIYDENTIRATYSAFDPGIPVVTISAADAELLKSKLAEDPEFQITLTVDTDYDTAGGTSYEVIGEIEGATDERIVYSAHLDHFFTGVQDNVSAVATLLGIAKGIKASGYTPNRTITFVFSGSHEIGPVNSAAPDLLGPWKLLTELKSDWVGKIVANINFEYTALSSQKLRGLTSYEMKGMYQDFLEYMPEKMDGLGTVEREVDPDNYYLLTWCDACTFIMKGVPVFMNDSVSEEIYEMISPYMGRDHSNMDNMDIYSAEAHLSTTDWFGCLGLYLDNKPVILPDYSARKAVLELSAEETECLDNEGIEYEEYQKQLVLFEKYGAAVKTVLKEYNENADICENSRRINRLMLKAQRLLADGTDGLTTTVPSMISVPHKVYIEKGKLFAQAAVVAAADGYAAAYEKALKSIDMAGIEEKFSADLAAKIKSLVMGENAKWNEGKCKNFFIREDVTEENWLNAYRENTEAIRESIKEETECLKAVNDLLVDIIIMATDTVDKDKMMSWIEKFTQFPHRKTGTAEGLASAKYVEQVFNEIGLQNVEIEPVKSVMMECPEYTLKADGDEIECFFANGTNRRAELGDFFSDIEDVEIVYLRTGSEEDFENIDVAGKLVLCDVFFKSLHPKDLLTWMDGAELYDPNGKTDKPLNRYDIYTPNNWPYNYIRAKERGAAGFVGILHNFMGCRYYHEDYIDIVNIGGYMDMPAVWVSKKDGIALAEKVMKGDVRGNLTVHTIFQEGEARIVKGEIKGRSEDIIVVHSHHDAVNRGAVQDASGMSVVFALADYFSKLPEDLMEKTIMFVATDSHYTDYEGHLGFLANRRANNENILIDYAIEHVAQEMDLDEDNNLLLTGEAETRMLYVEDREGLLEFVRAAVHKYNLEKTVIFPVKGKSGGDYTRDDVCSDAYDFNAAGIPVVSLLSAPMYLFHDSDTIDKVHRESLETTFEMFAYMITKTLQ